MNDVSRETIPGLEVEDSSVEELGIIPTEDAVLEKLCEAKTTLNMIIGYFPQVKKKDYYGRVRYMGLAVEADEALTQVCLEAARIVEQYKDE